MDWDAEDILPKSDWSAGLKCPFCGGEFDRDSSPDGFVVSARCSCGFSATMTPPRDLDPLKGVQKEIVL